MSDPHVRPVRWLLAVLVALVLIATSSSAWSPAAATDLGAARATPEASRVTLVPFRKEWVAHTRHVGVRDDIAVEVVHDGCCEQALRVRYRLSDPRRSGARLVVSAEVLRATYARWVSPSERVHRGDVRRLSIRGTRLFTPHTFYCDPDDYRPSCGA